MSSHFEGHPVLGIGHPREYFGNWSPVTNGKQNLSSPAGSEKTSGWSRAVVGRRFLGMESSVQRLAVNVLTSVVLCKLSGGVQSASSRREEIEEIV